MKSRIVFAALFLTGLLGVVAACSSDSSDDVPPITIAPVGQVDSGAGGGGTDTDAAACIATDPVSITDFLNACTDGTCVPFDNTRLPLYTPGQALPAIP